MGAFYNCICIPGERTDGVAASLGRWLSARGYRESTEPVLFDLDATCERSAFLVSNDRWTLVFYSHFEEERRLIRELQDEAPLVYVWVWDSDVWGWDLFDAGGFASSFSSDPQTHRSFDGAGESRPQADPAALCRVAGIDPEEAEFITRLDQRRGVYPEDICRELCLLLGAPPAAASYDELETGRAGAQLEGWTKEQVVYFHPGDAAAVGSMDLHEVEVDTGLRASRVLELPPALLEEMSKMRKDARRTLRLLKPVGAVAGLWNRTKELLDGRRRTEPGEPESHIDLQLTNTATRHQMRNQRHGVMIILSSLGEALQTSGKPSAVFAFQMGKVTVRCTARRLRHLSEVVRPPGRAHLLVDDPHHIGKLPARQLRFRLPRRGDRGHHLDLHIVQTYRALYVFHYRFGDDLRPEIESAIRSTIKTFQVLDESGRRDLPDAVPVSV